jgi:magnesium transporter
LIVPTGAPACWVYPPNSAPHRLDDLHAISEVLREPDTFVWLDAVEPQIEDLQLIADEFGLHPLAIEDAVKAHQRPKIEAYDSSYFVIVHGLSKERGELVVHEIAIFAGAKFIVTVRDRPEFPLDEIQRRWDASRNLLRHNSAALLYTILDTVVDGYTPIAESFEEHVEILESALLEQERRTDDVLLEILKMKNDLARFRHAAVPLRDVLTPIMRGDLHLFADDELPYYRDVYDHVSRVVDQMDIARDLINNARETHIALASHRQQEAARQLTITATIFLPLTFITGFFGQNFGFMVEHVASARAFWGLGVGGEVVALCILLAYFRYKRWF